MRRLRGRSTGKAKHRLGDIRLPVPDGKDNGRGNFGSDVIARRCKADKGVTTSSALSTPKKVFVDSPQRPKKPVKRVMAPCVGDRKEGLKCRQRESRQSQRQLELGYGSPERVWPSCY